VEKQLEGLAAAVKEKPHGRGTATVRRICQGWKNYKNRQKYALTQIYTWACENEFSFVFLLAPHWRLRSA
jgi:hypothetical protein